jgi:2,3-dihydroxybenzoate decarboxylase
LESEAYILLDTPYDDIEEAQAWWRTVDLDDDAKTQVGRTNAIKLFKLPLEY